MDDNLKEILDLLENDLKDIDSAVKHINNAKSVAQDVVDSTNELVASFRDHLTDLVATIGDFLAYNDEKSKEILKAWGELTTELSAMMDRLSKLTTYFESVNFPARLDKIDTTINNVNQGIQANQNLLNEIYRRLDEHSEKLKFQLLENQKSLKILKPLVIVIAIITLFSLIFSILSFLPN